MGIWLCTDSERGELEDTFGSRKGTAINENRAVLEMLFQRGGGAIVMVKMRGK